MGVYYIPKWRKKYMEKKDVRPLSDYTNEELLEFLGVSSKEDAFFRNYNYNEEQRREYLLELAEELNSKYT